MAKRRRQISKQYRELGSLQILLRSIWGSALTLFTERSNPISPQTSGQLGSKRSNPENVNGQCDHRIWFRQKGLGVLLIITYVPS